MTAHSNLIAFLSLLLPACAAAQSAAQQPKLSLLLPANTTSDKFEVRYYLYGSFGANGGYISEKPDSTEVVEIPLSVDGKTANAIKLFAWMPGCQFATYDIGVHESDIQDVYSCNPLPTVLLRWQIADIGLLQRGSSEIRVHYLAGWACEFFGLSDCSVPEISLGTVIAAVDGRFEIELPDFAQDPGSDSKTASEFQLVLRNVQTWNLIAFLDPESKMQRTAGGGLRSASWYAAPVIFNARKIND